MRNRPARRFGDKAKPLLPIEAIDLIDNAVNIIIKGCAVAVDFAVMRKEPPHIIKARHIGVHLKSPFGKCFNHRHLALARQRAHLTPRIGKKLQGPCRRDLRVKLAQRPRRRIARVHIGLFALRLHAFIERKKVFLAHINFAAHLNHIGNSIAQ